MQARSLQIDFVSPPYFIVYVKPLVLRLISPVVSSENENRECISVFALYNISRAEILQRCLYLGSNGLDCSGHNISMKDVLFF